MSLTASQQRQHAQIALQLLEENAARLAEAQRRHAHEQAIRDRLATQHHRIILDYRYPLLELAKTYLGGWFSWPSPQVDEHTVAAHAQLRDEADYRLRLQDALDVVPEPLRTKLIVSGMRELRHTRLWQQAYKRTESANRLVSVLDARQRAIIQLKNS